MITFDTLIAQIVEATAERLIPRIERAVRDAITEKPEPRIYFAPELAKRLGKTTDGFRMWLKRGGAELATLAIDIGGRQAWRADDVEAYLSRKPKLRAMAGGVR